MKLGLRQKTILNYLKKVGIKDTLEISMDLRIPSGICSDIMISLKKNKSVEWCTDERKESSGWKIIG